MRVDIIVDAIMLEGAMLFDNSYLSVQCLEKRTTCPRNNVCLISCELRLPFYVGAYHLKGWVLLDFEVSHAARPPINLQHCRLSILKCLESQIDIRVFVLRAETETIHLEINGKRQIL